jgi:hypothetical protein
MRPQLRGHRRPFDEKNWSSHLARPRWVSVFLARLAPTIIALTSTRALLMRREYAVAYSGHGRPCGGAHEKLLLIVAAMHQTNLTPSVRPFFQTTSQFLPLAALGVGDRWSLVPTGATISASSFAPSWETSSTRQSKLSLLPIKVIQA